MRRYSQHPECLGRVGFTSEEEAKSNLKSPADIGQSSGDDVYVAYKCEHCGDWHRKWKVPKNRKKKTR